MAEVKVYEDYAKDLKDSMIYDVSNQILAKQGELNMLDMVEIAAAATTHIKEVRKLSACHGLEEFLENWCEDRDETGKMLVCMCSVCPFKIPGDICAVKDFLKVHKEVKDGSSN